MKTIRTLTIMAGLSLMFLAFGATGAQAQVIRLEEFTGKVTLPTETHWGRMTLPAGDYTLRYGDIGSGGVSAVEIIGKAKGSMHGTVLAGAPLDVSSTRNSLVCTREGGTLYVRALEMPEIHQAIAFHLPGSMTTMARKATRGARTLLAENPVLIQRIPVDVSAK